MAWALANTARVSSAKDRRPGMLIRVFVFGVRRDAPDLKGRRFLLNAAATLCRQASQDSRTNSMESRPQYGEAQRYRWTEMVRVEGPTVSP